MFSPVVKEGKIIKTASEVMKEYVKEILTAKNIQKMPRTLSSRMDDFQSAEYFQLPAKMKSYGEAIEKFCNALQAREFNSLPETVKSDLLPDEVLKARALVHARKVRELSELNQRIAEKKAELENSEGRIPYAQREEFGKLLVSLQNIVATESL